MKRLSILVISCLFLVNLKAQTKRALIIAVSNYKEFGPFNQLDWKKISSKNDIPLIKNVLLRHGFENNNIDTLVDEQATYNGIKEAWDNLILNSKENDIVVLHFSMHGQQMTDVNNDELDNLDEVLIPYDARKYFSQVYQGQNHLHDDLIQLKIHKLRKKLGSKGHLLLIVDSCFSGTIARGGVVRGSNDKFKIPKKYWKKVRKQQGLAIAKEKTENGIVDNQDSSGDLAPYVVISGSQAGQKNYEMDGKGSLSFAFSEVTNRLTDQKNVTYRTIVDEINTFYDDYDGFPTKQDAIAEGKEDMVFLDNNYLPTDRFYNIKSFNSKDQYTIEINAGKLNQVFVGTTFIVLDNTARTKGDKDPISTATVTNASFNSATLKLSKPLPKKNKEAYRIFIDKSTFGDINVSIYLNHLNPSLKKKVDSLITKKFQFGNVTDIENEALYTATSTSDSIYIYKTQGDSIPLRRFSLKNKDDKKQAELLVDNIYQIGKLQYLKKIIIKNETYKTTFELIPIRLPDDTVEDYKKYMIEEELSKYYVNGRLSVIPFADRDFPNKDAFVLKVKNHSKTEKVYFNIVEFSNYKSLFRLYPQDTCELKPHELLIEPNEEIILDKCGHLPFVIAYGRPYESSIRYKLFASPTPINLDESLFEDLNVRNLVNPNPLELFLASKNTKSRTIEEPENPNPDDVYTYDLDYDIVESRNY